MRVPLLPDRPQGEAIQLCLFHQASAVLLIPAALLPVDDRDRDIFAMLKIPNNNNLRKRTTNKETSAYDALAHSGNAYPQQILQYYKLRE